MSSAENSNFSKCEDVQESCFFCARFEPNEAFKHELNAFTREVAHNVLSRLQGGKCELHKLVLRCYMHTCNKFVKTEEKRELPPKIFLTKLFPDKEEIEKLRNVFSKQKET